MKFIKFVIALLFISTTSFYAQEWSSIRSDNPSIDLYIDRAAKDDVYTIRASTILKASINKISEVIETPENYRNWLYRYETAELLQKKENYFEFRAIISAPIPLKNRRLKVAVDKQNISKTSILYQLNKLPFPKESVYCSKCTSILDMKGKWYLESLSEYKTKITHTLTIQLKAPLPRAFVYRLMLKGPTKSFEKLESY